MRYVKLTLCSALKRIKFNVAFTPQFWLAECKLFLGFKVKEYLKAIFNSRTLEIFQAIPKVPTTTKAFGRPNSLLARPSDIWWLARKTQKARGHTLRSNSEHQIGSSIWPQKRNCYQKFLRDGIARKSDTSERIAVKEIFHELQWLKSAQILFDLTFIKKF